MTSTDITHAASSYGIHVEGEINLVDDHWEFQGVNYAHAESTPRLFRADKKECGGYQIRQIRKRQLTAQ